MASLSIARRRTSNQRIYAIGDCRSGPRFTHVSGYEGSNVALEIALGIPAKADFSALPRCTFTSPELAQVGMTEAEARTRHGNAVRVIRQDFADNDRAVCEGASEGFLKLVMKGRKVLGATAVGDHAGELLLPWSQVICGQGLHLRHGIGSGGLPNAVGHLEAGRVRRLGTDRIRQMAQAPRPARCEKPQDRANERRRVPNRSHRPLAFRARCAAMLSPGKFADPLRTADGSERASVPLVALETLWFNTGTLCNLACAGCYIESSPTNDALVYLKAGEVSRFLDEIAGRWQLPTREIGFTGGEPFMNPDIMARSA